MLVRNLLKRNPQRKVENKKNFTFIGLWNPQKEYKKTRHNIGADSLFAFCEKYNINLKNHKSGKFQIGSYEIDDCELDVVVPMVSMNNSGEALREYLKNKNFACTFAAVPKYKKITRVNIPTSEFPSVRLVKPINFYPSSYSSWKKRIELNI